MDYHVVYHYKIPDFVKEVNRLIKCGWKVTGGASVSITTRNSNDVEHVYIQSLIKEENNEQ